MVKTMKQTFKEVRSEYLPSEREKRLLLRDVAKRVEARDKSERKSKLLNKRHLLTYRRERIKGEKGTPGYVQKGVYDVTQLRKSFGVGKKDSVKRRERATRGVLTAMGVIQGPQTRSGAGRPSGTYKYGMPIHVYKKMMRDKKAQYQRFQQEQAMKLQSRGFTPEQLQQLQQQQVIQQMQQPQQYSQEYDEDTEESQNYEEMPTQVTPQMPQNQQRQGYGRIIPRSQQVQQGRSVADDELEFRQWSAERTISPRTQRVLDMIRRIQNKGKTDNIEQQRRHRERMMVANQMNLLKAHENMINTKMDFTGVDPDENILMAKNIWKQREDNNIMRTNRSNILSGEHNLKFF